MNARMNQAMGRAKLLSSGFTPGQRGIVVVGIALLVLGALALSRWAAQPSWTPLYAKLSSADASAVAEELKAQNIPSPLTDGGNTVLVPQASVYELRVALGAKGIPAGDGGGDSWALLDNLGMTTTEFQQNTTYQRALEGELGKTLKAISGVNTAVVHLAIPKRDVFATEQDAPTAAVLLSLAPGTELSRSQVRSVTRLVAGSVPGLDAARVTVTDGNGSLLTSPTDGAGGDTSAATEADQQTAQYEDRVGAKVQQALEQILGPGHAVVRVSAQLDYSNRHIVSTSYAGATPSVPPLSERLDQEAYGGGGAGVGGVMGLITPSGILASPSNGQYARSDITRNNAVNSIVTDAVAAPGTVQRLSASVILDAKTAGSIDTTLIQGQVANMLGIDSKRGDTVQVDKLPFDTTATEAAKKDLEKAQAAERTAGYVDMGTKGGIALVVLVLGIIAAIRRKKAGPTVRASATDLPPGMFLPNSMQALPSDALRELGPGVGIGAGGLPSIDDPLELNPVAERDKLRAEVSTFVDQQPEEIAQLVQGWIGTGTR